MRAHVPGAAGEVGKSGKRVGEQRLPDLGRNAGVLSHQARAEQSGGIARVALEVLGDREGIHLAVVIEPAAIDVR